MAARTRRATTTWLNAETLPCRHCSSRRPSQQAIPLVDATLGWAQGGNKPMLRLCLERLLPPRREAPVWLNLPPIETRGDLRQAMKAVANAVAQGDLGAAHGLRLVRMFNEIYAHL
jgi:hypothetical protein